MHAGWVLANGTCCFLNYNLYTSTSRSMAPTKVTISVRPKNVLFTSIKHHPEDLLKKKSTKR